MRRALTLVLVLGGAAACFGCDEAAEEVEEVEEPEAVEPEETVVPDEPAAPSYTIHEWGLIDVDLGERRVEYAAGPGRAEAPTHAAAGDDGDDDGTTRPRLPATGREVVDRTVDTATGVLDALTGRNAPRRKPVLYFHLDAPSPGFRFDLSVNLGTGAIVEHFPTATLADHQVTWSQVELASESCAGGPYPTAESPVCQGIRDGYCEAAELGTYVSDDAGCLTFGGGQQNFLFYRGDGPAPDLPLTITRNADGTVTVTNASMAAPVGELLRLRRTNGVIQVAQVAIPASGSSVSVGLPATAAADTHRDTIRSQLRSIGLTEGEAAAFERAWFAELFDAEAATPHAFVDAVFFFLPTSQVDGFAHLEATPAPSATVRAMAVRAGWTTL